MREQLNSALSIINGGGWNVRGGKEAYAQRGNAVRSAHVSEGEGTIIVEVPKSLALRLALNRVTGVSGLAQEDPYEIQFRGLSPTQVQRKKRDGGGFAQAMQEISLLTVWSDTAHARFEQRKDAFAREVRRARDLGMPLSALKAYDASRSERQQALVTHTAALNERLQGSALLAMRVVDGVVQQDFEGGHTLRIALVDVPVRKDK